jgi:drug/metabolite transporter (DMT)-like permease
VPPSPPALDESGMVIPNPSPGDPGLSPSGRDSSAADLLLLVVPGLIWGASFLFIAEGLRSIGPNGVTFVRILIGFLTLSLLPAARRQVARADWPAIAALGVVWMAFPLTMFPFAEERVSSALTGMLNGATALFVAIVAAGIARQLPSRGVTIGLGVGLVGAVLIAWPTLAEGQSSLTGVLLIVLALMSYGVALNLARPLQLRNGALPVVWRALAVALLLTAPFGVPDLLTAHWIPAAVFSLLALGALGTGLAYALLAVAAGRMGATRASATTFLIPPVALVLGLVIRSEQVAPLSAFGGLVCVAGAWVIRQDQTRGPVVSTPRPQPKTI